MTPRLSIISVNLNDLARLKRTLNSILGQTATDFEWLIIDGYSVDGSVDLVQNHLDDGRMRYLMRRPGGIYDAMNYALQMSLGEYCWFINSGDVLMSKNSVSFVLEHLQNNSGCNLYSPVLHLTNNGRFFDVTIPKIEEKNGEIVALTNHQGAIIAKEDWLRCGSFDVNLKFAADGKLLDCISSNSKVVISNSIWVGFEMGGTAAKNFVNTYREISTYRKNVKKGSKFLILVLKNRLRLLMLRMENFTVTAPLVDSYLRKRELSTLHYLIENKIKIN